MPMDGLQPYRTATFTVAILLLSLSATAVPGQTPFESAAGDSAFDPSGGPEVAAEDDENECRWLNSWLVGDCFTQRSGFFVEGWLQQGFTWNPDDPVDRFNGPVTQNDRANEYQLNQLYLIAARPANSEADHLTFGFQADILYGTDGVFFTSLGLDDKIVSDTASRFYKMALPQLYAEVYAPLGRGIMFQIGKWYTPVGYETGLATQDFFYSKPIAFVPVQYTHTGIQATFDLTDQLSTFHGIHRGSDAWEDANNALGYSSGFIWTSLSETTTMSFAMNLGPEQDERTDWQDLDGVPGPDAPGESLNRVNYFFALEQQLCEKWQYVFVHDYFYQDGDSTGSIENAEAYGLTQYLFYEHCDHLSAGLRLEVYRDDDGYVSACRSQNAASPGLYTNLTAGIQARPRDCLMLRSEVRWDWQDRDSPLDTPAFDAGTKNNQFLFSVDAVLRF